MRVFIPLLLLLLTACQKEVRVDNYALIPLPQNIVYGNDYLVFKQQLSFHSNSPEGVLLQDVFTKTGQQHGIQLTNASEQTPLLLSYNPQLKPEAYGLYVEQDKVVIESASEAGWIYGWQSFLQMLPLNQDGPIRLRCVEVKDEPRFSYRGMHLDVSRHFFSLDEVKQLVDHMTYFKLNKLHLHLTDDQGWRLQIDQYPLLTKNGAWRNHNTQDSLCLALSKEDATFIIPEEHYKTIDGDRKYGGFYTKDEMRDLIKYCDRRNIEVIPEIDIPGHFNAAINNYPYLSCTDGGGWGTHFSYPACLGKEVTYEFIKNILDEVAELFPSKYIHIGGDEVNKDEWKKCARCQKAIRLNGLKDEHELQSHFNHQIEAFLSQKGKKLIGWDEIVEGGLSKESTVMWWRNWAPNSIREAAKNGNDIIVTPDFEYYFDFPYSATPTSKVYNFEPIPSDFSAEMADKVIGVQANVWTERIPNVDRLYYQVLPRMLALAESGWTTKKLKEYDAFEMRLKNYYQYFENKGLFYHLKELKGFEDECVFTEKSHFSIEVPDSEYEVYYTLDGTAPTKQSAKYSGQIEIDKSLVVRFRAYKGSVYSKIYEAKYSKQSLAEPVNVAVKSGLLQQHYKGRYWKCHDVDLSKKPDANKVVSNFGLKGYEGHENYALVFNGYYQAPVSGVYTFFTNSDDGDQLFIHNQLVVNNDPSHGPRTKKGAIALKAGLHPLRLIYSQIGGGAVQEVFVKPPNEAKRMIESNELFYKD